LIAVAIVFGMTLIFGTAGADEKALNFFANTELAKIGHDKVIVKAVKDQNKKGMSLADIKAMDNKWKAEEGLADYMQDIMYGGCGPHIREIWRNTGYLAEIFVMDNQGANVCMTEKTGDFWQGDEGKFWYSFNGGIGAVFVDEVEEDDAKIKHAQVSVPVMDKGKAIGAITFDVYVDQVK
ncbi:MAG: hypothetical protein JSV26_05435, partial [bacterium]